MTRSTIAVCEFKELAGIGGVIGYTQTPGAPIAVAGTLTGGEAGDVFDIKITQYGDITNDCTKMGLEFNAWGKQSKMASVAYQSGSM